MSLKYEHASEPLHISVKKIVFQFKNKIVFQFKNNYVEQEEERKRVDKEMANIRKHFKDVSLRTRRTLEPLAW